MKLSLPSFAEASEGDAPIYYVLLKRYNGTLAQLVEQRTENPCVPGSIPGGTTSSTKPAQMSGFLVSGNVKSLLF